MGHTGLSGLAIFSGLLVILSNASPAMAAAAKDACECEVAAGQMLNPPLVGATLEQIIRNGLDATPLDTASTCETQHFPGGELFVLVQPSSSGIGNMSATAERAGGLLACQIRVDSLNLTVDMVGLSRSSFNSCKRSIRQLCGNIADLIVAPAIINATNSPR